MLVWICFGLTPYSILSLCDIYISQYMHVIPIPMFEEGGQLNARTYVDAQGKRRCVGTSLLRSTQSYPLRFGEKAVEFAQVSLSNDSHPVPIQALESELDKFLGLPIDDFFEDVCFSVPCVGNCLVF